MSQYPAAKQALEEYARSHPYSFSIYNPSGNYILRIDDGTTYVSYAFRAANPEGMRRAALLVAQLRARGVAAAAAGDEVANCRAARSVQRCGIRLGCDARRRDFHGARRQPVESPRVLLLIVAAQVSS